MEYFQGFDVFNISRLQDLNIAKFTHVRYFKSFNISKSPKVSTFQEFQDSKMIKL